MSQAFAISSPPLRSARVLLHPAEDIGSALKGGVNVSQRQPINEVFRPLVTKFVRNFGREGATLSDIMRTPTIGRLLNAPGSKWCRQTAGSVPDRYTKSKRKPRGCSRGFRL